MYFFFSIRLHVFAVAEFFGMCKLWTSLVIGVCAGSAMRLLTFEGRSGLVGCSYVFCNPSEFFRD